VTSDNNDDNKETLCAVFLTFFAVPCDTIIYNGLFTCLHWCQHVSDNK